MSAPAVGAPRVAVTWADSAPSHEPWFHAELAGLTASAAAALEAAGARAVVLDAAAGALPAAEDFDGVVVMGGGDVDPALYGGDAAHPTIDGVDRAADAAEAHLVRGALAAARPVLGICRGLQLVNVVLGGSLHEDLPRTTVDGAPGMHLNQADPTGPMVLHDVAIEPGTRLAGVLGDRARVVSGHHQAAAVLGAGLRVSATASDGVIEAVEAADPDVWLVAVQWHPEDPQTVRAAPGQLEAIMGAFVAACRDAPRTRSRQPAATAPVVEEPRPSPRGVTPAR
ncbi:gamma-glutamyl-gamma-aminobutyrate hydrolase family protein [Sinomonas atrocyanea]|uniref:gamma-glutamyl-gamma-aminobutyrate hydrolase family protein n=1 Tax=Sinomonas atrocyanea TaxID=37927 RepID=UPI002785814A|nr:gamma-glutamyl-gamma-aminobutyrate hydrolase family protein [Sinomonas atrocyanea]MDQ0260111.1 putative glutamine amidotransferase [Sinomonas atrocyanea]MDR6620174.1 putative glutamine amidotransferase [Sinomonas atrocyanea]